MKKIITGILITCMFIVSFGYVYAQERLPFYDEIQNFKRQDSAKFPALRQILFVGSSSFNFWKDVQSYFPTHPIINRGFGGSTLLDVIRYANDIIFPYQPKQIVIYCGENDLAYADTVTATIVFNRFQQLFNLIRQKMPGENIMYVSIKPSPSRQYLMPKMVVANNKIKDFLAQQKNTSFVDVYHLMLDANGKPMAGIYRDDNLHMNPNGYAIWQKAIEPYLIK